MASISAAMVKELRERTGVGMMECKKALMETNGDIEKAIEELKKQGQMKAEKKGGRTTAEGLVAVLHTADNKQGIMLEINCETDFVAKGDAFIQFTNQVAKCALDNHIDDVDTLKATECAQGKNVEAMRLELVTQVGENITVRRLQNLKAPGTVGCYAHGGQDAAKICAMVALNSDDQALARDLAMHVAAMNPECLTEKDVSEARIQKEKEIFISQAREQNPDKPEDLLEKIVMGKIKKFTKEITLLGQPFVKDPKQTIQQLIQSKGAEIVSFVRYEVGEGIEKKEDDFVSEVMSQVRGE